MNTRLTFEIEADEIELFLQDVNEHLQVMEEGILRLEQGADAATLNATFRAAHTLKAISATVGHTQMAELTHTLETLFDALREGKLTLTQAVTDQLLSTVDVLKALRDEVVTREPSGVDAEGFMNNLRALLERGADAPPSDVSPASGFLLTLEQIVQVETYRAQGYHILEVEAATRSDAFAQSARLLQVAMTAAEHGHVLAQQPSSESLSTGQHAGRLWLMLATQEQPEVVQAAIGQIVDVAECRVQPYAADAPIPAQPAAAEMEPPPPPSNDQLAPVEQTVRISVERLDTLMNLVGELVTDRTRLIQIRDTLRVQYGKEGIVGALSEMATHFERVVDQLQEEVMQARMLPIKHLFQKFPRLVRDLSRASGKQVNLVIEGEATELDRSVIEVIGDPLIHLLRNAVDHGIESPRERVLAGKPPTGTVWLTAAHQEGHIVIHVRDDGRGIDPQRIRRAAVQRGLLSEEEAAKLDDDAAINLIFQPNLSTAEQITDVSGRGVGLDVVRTNVQRLSGSVVVESAVGRGATFRVTLPLTLAIVQAMMVAVGQDVYAIPLTSIVESLYLASAHMGTIQGKPVVTWRDQVLPVVRLREFFAHRRMTPAPAGAKEAIVAVAWGRLKAGLVVDNLIGKQEIVIKSLGHFIGNTPGLSGCTILGDGRIALIVDIPGLIGATLKGSSANLGPI